MSSMKTHCGEEESAVLVLDLAEPREGDVVRVAITDGVGLGLTRHQEQNGLHDCWIRKASLLSQVLHSSRALRTLAKFGPQLFASLTPVSDIGDSIDLIVDEAGSVSHSHTHPSVLLNLEEREATSHSLISTVPFTEATG
ncbi:hypothetical protein NP233_g4822 [Leucocoprinus birnbaumii]|uniref:Uncharacterized protein n=1 Tax=Leucocoprinus birnbaumii TaxID=56174 RepID=A0AAD5VU01_9AGAR|nr:hypothetical protein NP233_g4822 [Leucocoprinus birnbaumii]